MPLQLDAVSLQWLQCPCIVPESGCSVNAVDAMTPMVNAVCCDEGCSATSVGCSVPAVVVVQRACSLHMNSVPMQWRQCHRRWMQYIVTEDAVLTKVDEACCDLGCSAHEGGCSDPAMMAVPHAVSMNWDAVLMQCMQCPTRWMKHVVT